MHFPWSNSCLPEGEREKYKEERILNSELAQQVYTTLITELGGLNLR